MSSSGTTTPGRLAPVHPGEVLLEDFLKPLGMSQYALVRAIGVPPRRINEVIHGTRAVTPDTGLRLSRYFNLSNTFWLALQTRYDIDVTMDKLGDSLERDIAPLPRAG